MLYNCWRCGWRIKNETGYLMCDHHAFCSTYCIESYKTNPNNIQTESPDWCETGSGLCDHPEHHGVGWKKTRKIFRNNHIDN